MDRLEPLETRLPEVAAGEDDQGWARVKPRHIDGAQWERFAGYMAEIFAAMGMDLGTPATSPTPMRFLRGLYEATEGYEGDPKLVTAFPTECRGGPDCETSQVIEGPVPFFALCEHHAFPFIGHVYVGYIAHENIIGISKLTRLVRLYGRRFSVQERIGQELADGLDAVLKPHGVAVYVEAAHLCMQMRGVREVESKTWTTYWRGAYAASPQLRQEFLSICRMGSAPGSR